MLGNPLQVTNACPGGTPCPGCQPKGSSCSVVDAV